MGYSDVQEMLEAAKGRTMIVHKIAARFSAKTACGQDAGTVVKSELWSQVTCMGCLGNASYKKS